MNSKPETIRLSEVAKLVTDKIELVDISKSNYISTDNMLPNFSGIEKANAIPRLKKVNAFQSGDILFSNIRTYFKKLWFANIHGGCSADVLVFRPKNNDIDNRFLYYVLQNDGFISYTVTTSKGTKMPRGDKTAILNYQFNKPPLSDQKKIAYVLSTLDNKIELNKKINQTLESLVQTIFKSWFVDFDPVHAKANAQSEDEYDAIAKELGISREILDLFPSEFEESELGLIPKGWECTKFFRLIDSYIDNRGKTPPFEKDGIPLLEVRNLPETMLVCDHKVEKYVSEEISKNWFRAHLKEDDILISTVGTIGLTCIVPPKSNFVIAQNVLGIRFNNMMVLQKFMYYLMKTKIFLNEIEARLVTTVQKSIKRKDLNTIEFVIPPMALQMEFVKLTSPLISFQQNNQSSLEKIKNNLLPKLLSGEIDVSNLNLEPEND
ncbi:TPA: restriction endonuclease subunit S [Legionella feeleii]